MIDSRKARTWQGWKMPHVPIGHTFNQNGPPKIPLPEFSRQDVIAAGDQKQNGTLGTAENWFTSS